MRFFDMPFAFQCLRGALLVGFVVVVCGFPVGADEIHFRDGRIEKGDQVVIQDENYDKVSYQVRGFLQEDKPENIVKIVHTTGKTSRYKKAENMMRQGDFQEALALFNSLKRTNRPKWIAHYAYYYSVDCNRRLGQFSKAEEALIDLGRKYSKSRFLPLGQARLAGSLLKAGEYDRAEKAYGKLAKDAKSKNFPREWDMRAQLGKADVQVAKGNYSSARKTYNDLIYEARSVSKSLEFEAKLGASRIDVAEKNGKKAISRLEAGVDGGGVDDELLATAYNVIGDGYRVMGQSKNAIKAYLRVHLMFGHVRSEQPSSLYWASKLFPKSGLEKGAQKGKRLKEILTREYPDWRPPKSHK